MAGNMAGNVVPATPCDGRALPPGTPWWQEVWEPQARAEGPLPGSGHVTYAQMHTPTHVYADAHTLAHRHARTPGGPLRLGSWMPGGLVLQPGSQGLGATPGAPPGSEG